MRSDNLNRDPQAQEAAKTDAATTSGLAAALAPSDDRIEALRLQVERGEYRVSSQDVASSIIDEHLIDEHVIDEHAIDDHPGGDEQE